MCIPRTTVEKYQTCELSDIKILWDNYRTDIEISNGPTIVQTFFRVVVSWRCYVTLPTKRFLRNTCIYGYITTIPTCSHENPLCMITVTKSSSYMLLLNLFHPLWYFPFVNFWYHEKRQWTYVNTIRNIYQSTWEGRLLLTLSDSSLFTCIEFPTHSPL